MPLYGLIAAQMFKMRTRQSMNSLEVPTNINLIYGHMQADKFDSNNGQYFSSIVFRDPLNRMRSHFTHWQRNFGLPMWKTQIPYIDGMTFEQFAMLPELKNYQEKTLGSKSLESFDLIGVTENLDVFATQIVEARREHLAVKPLLPVTLQRFNVAPNLPLGSDANFVDKFKKQHSHDYEIYRHAREASLL